MGAKLRTWGAWHEEGDRKGSEGTSPSVRNNGILTWLVGRWQTVVETTVGTAAGPCPPRRHPCGAPSPSGLTLTFAPMGLVPVRECWERRYGPFGGRVSPLGRQGL